MGILSVNWKHANQKIDVFPKFSFNPYLYLTYVWSISWISPRSWWHLLKARSASCPMLTCDGAHGMSTIHVDPGLICQALVSQTDPKWKCWQVVLGQWDLCRIQDGASPASEFAFAAARACSLSLLLSFATHQESPSSSRDNCFAAHTMPKWNLEYRCPSLQLPSAFRLWANEQTAVGVIHRCPWYRKALDKVLAGAPARNHRTSSSWRWFCTSLRGWDCCTVSIVVVFMC